MKAACFYILLLIIVAACNAPERKKVSKVKPDYIRPIDGENEAISADTINKGKILIAYNDCYTCHKENDRSFGPAFDDIAKRYPTNKVFIKMLAQKVIAGGKGSWGNAVMLAHPKLSVADAEAMTSYVLSLNEE